MTTLLLAILTASLVGSLHCAGMCGPFLAFVVGAGPASAAGASRGTHGGSQRSASAWRLQLAYHLARGVGYTLLGATAGAAGHLVDLAGALSGLQPLAAALAGLTLVVIGLSTLAHLSGWRALTARGPLARLTRAGLPAGLAGLLRRVQSRALRLPPTGRALAIGATTTLLPCGWLYAFAVTAAGTGAPLAGMLVMAVFWAGTLPVLVSLGAAVRSATRLFGPRLRASASLALVVLGLFTLSGRLQLEPLALARTVEAEQSDAGAPSTESPPACCAERKDEASSQDGANDGVR
jgi:sulfite exporter TauE/SafE